MSRYRKSMTETMVEVEKIGNELPEVSPPGWKGSVKAMKKHKDIDNPWALAWHMKNKGDKPHYKDQDGPPKKKEKYKNEEMDTDGVVQLDEIAPVVGAIGKVVATTAGQAVAKAGISKAKAAISKNSEKGKKEDVEVDEGPAQDARMAAAKRRAATDNKRRLDTLKRIAANKIEREKQAAAVAGRKGVRQQSGTKQSQRRWREETEIDELSSDLLGRYKTKAAAQSSAAAKAGDHKKSHKRFKGITKATSKQFDNDAKAYDKRHEESEIGEDMEFKVKIKGLPSFYVPGKSAAAVKMLLRRQVKRPDDIESVDRVTTSAKRKDFRMRGQGKTVEPKKDGE